VQVHRERYLHYSRMLFVQICLTEQCQSTLKFVKPEKIEQEPATLRVAVSLFALSLALWRRRRHWRIKHIVSPCSSTSSTRRHSVSALPTLLHPSCMHDRGFSSRPVSPLLHPDAAPWFSGDARVHTPRSRRWIVTNEFVPRTEYPVPKFASLQREAYTLALPYYKRKRGEKEATIVPRDERSTRPQEAGCARRWATPCTLLRASFFAKPLSSWLISIFFSCFFLLGAKGRNDITDRRLQISPWTPGFVMPRFNPSLRGG